MIPLCTKLAHEANVVSASLITHWSAPLLGYTAVLLGMAIHMEDDVTP